MNIVDSLVAQNNNANKSKSDKIKLLQDQINELDHEISSSHNLTLEKITQHYSSHPEENVAFPSLFKNFEDDQVISLLLSILKKRTLREDEISSELIALIESKNSKEIFDAFKNSFEDFSDKLKLSIALSCYGYGNMAELADYIGEYITAKYGVFVKYPKNKNHLSIDDSYDRVSAQTYIQLTTHENCEKDLDSIAENILRLLQDGYNNTHFNVFEHNLSARGSVYLNVRDEKGEICTPVVSGSYREYEASGDNPKEQLLDALKYISKHYWYSTDRDREEEDSY